MKSKSNRFFTPNDLSNSTTFDKFVLRVSEEMVLVGYGGKQVDVMIQLHKHTVVFPELLIP